MLDMERREFITLIGGGVLLLAAKLKRARAQQPAMPVVGYLSARSPQDTAHLAEAFRRGLAEAGFVEGQNVLIEYRWAFGQHDRLPGLAADLVRNPLTVLVTTGGGRWRRWQPRPRRRRSPSPSS
jgi:putative ABC transport system substrate-binding protein